MISQFMEWLAYSPFGEWCLGIWLWLSLLWFFWRMGRKHPEIESFHVSSTAKDNPMPPHQEMPPHG